MKTENSDMIMIGAGDAAFAAAVAAREIREFVHDVEESDFASMEIPSYSAGQFMGDLQPVTQGRIDSERAFISTESAR